VCWCVILVYDWEEWSNVNNNKTPNIHFFEFIVLLFSSLINFKLHLYHTLWKLKKHYQSLSSMEYTIFLVSPYLPNTNKLDGLPPREHARNRYRLAMRFIDCHCECQSHWKLNPFEFNWDICSNNRDSW